MINYIARDIAKAPNELLTLVSSLKKPLWERANKTKGGCWIWKTSKNINEYPTVNIRGKSYKAHRLSFLLKNKELPELMYVCHSCDMPACINPNHLFLGSHSDNIIDSVQKKRHVQARKNKCINGHEYTHVDSNNKRACNTCLRNTLKKWRKNNPEKYAKQIEKYKNKRALKKWA